MASSPAAVQCPSCGVTRLGVADGDDPLCRKCEALPSLSDLAYGAPVDEPAAAPVAEPAAAPVAEPAVAPDPAAVAEPAVAPVAEPAAAPAPEHYNMFTGSTGPATPAGWHVCHTPVQTPPRSTPCVSRF